MLTMATVAAREPAAEGVSEGARDEVATLKEENRMLRQTLLAAQTEASRKHADLLKFVVVVGVWRVRIAEMDRATCRDMHVCDRILVCLRKV